MEKIKRLWFDEYVVHMESTEARTYKLPLVGSPRLLNATPEERDAYSIELDGTAIRWDNVDEDIFITAFYDYQDGSQNKIANLFFKYPMLSVGGMAKAIGIDRSLLYQYVYGVKTPSSSREREIFKAFRDLGAELSQI